MTAQTQTRQAESGRQRPNRQSQGASQAQTSPKKPSRQTARNEGNDKATDAGQENFNSNGIQATMLTIRKTWTVTTVPTICRTQTVMLKPTRSETKQRQPTT